MRHVLTALACLLMLAGCVSTPKPFEHDAGDDEAFRPKQDKVEVAVATPANMPDNMARRVAAALAIELQSYNIVATVQPARAPLGIVSAMSTRDAEFGTGIEIEIEWYLLGKSNGVKGPAISKTVVQARDYAEASDKLVSRIAQQAAPRVATLMGKPPVFEARAPGQVAAGANNPLADETPPVQTAAAAGTTPPTQPAAAAKPLSTPRQTKVMVGSIEGAPSDGNRQLLGGMRRALGSSRVVVVDSAGADTFVVSAKVKLTPTDDRTGQLELSWFLKDPSGKEIGKVDQSNPVPLAAARGSWAGFGDIVAQAAVEGILELIEQATKKPQ